MIRLENIEFEKSIIDEHYHIAVPVQITVFADGRKELLVYSFCEKLAEEFENTFTDLLSEEALTWLADRLAPIMEELEYDSSSMMMHSHREYRLTPAQLSALAPAAKEAELLTVLTDADRETEAELELDAFEMDGSNPDDAMTVIRENGQIVCFAAVNDIIENDTTGGLDWIELNVECGEAWRRKGYGAACVTALTRYYLEKGKGVKYLCDEENIPSIHTAERVGYSLYSQVVPMVYYTRDTDEEDED
ncbi:MAG: GNAT family N-acetyltransferase [Clostridia bacterium]|nr:GNAT family N-acetyltransferase [Clostridia bacterium]